MRILILYPGLFEERRRLVEGFRWQLRLTGTKIVLADECLHAGDEKAFSDVLLLPPAENAIEAWEVLARYLERYPVDGIIAQSEPSLLLGARAAREFDLPGPTVESVLASVNKFDSRTRLQAAGVAQPSFALVHDAAGIRRFAREFGWPVVIKATASSRQRLVLCVNGEQDVEAATLQMHAGLPHAKDIQRLVAFAELEGTDLGLDPLRDFLVESFQDGLPLECDAMLSGTTPHWFGVCEQLPSERPGFFIEGYLLPGRLTEAQQDTVLQTARAAVRALGLAHTGVSVELRLDDMAPYIIEVNGRLPWDDGLHGLIEASTGCVPGAFALKVALGKSLPKVKLRKHAALIYKCCYEEGMLDQTPSPSEWKSSTAGTHAAWMFAKNGEHLLPGEHPDSRPHLAGVLSTDKKSTETALRLAQLAIDRVQLNITPLGNDVCIPQAKPADQRLPELATHTETPAATPLPNH
ncbi:MAG: ATP-grasp domain-containing protein [Planctomycetes bacterium]|nr:ATP-grasp domain-containing protein [Planctomycetota bacterium]